jgi:GTPase SAR1 family protein
VGFDNVKSKWVHEVQSHVPGTPFLIVGTKADLRQSDKTANESTLITFEEGEQFAKKLSTKYIECSALTMTGIKIVFDQVVLCILRFSS